MCYPCHLCPKEKGLINPHRLSHMTLRLSILFMLVTRDSGVHPFHPFHAACTPFPTSDESFAYTPEMERETRVELRSRLPCVSGLVRPHYHMDVCKSLVEGPSDDTYGRCVARGRRMPERNYHSFARLIPANANGVLCKEGAISSGVDPLSGSGPFGIHTSGGKLDPPLESVCAGPTDTSPKT